VMCDRAAGSATLTISACDIRTESALSLRFLQ
jgi:hypothetical protein